MRGFSAPDLRQLRESTARSSARLLVSRQRARTDAQWYRGQADLFRTPTAGTSFPNAVCASPPSMTAC
jgi:hypothetical protein